MQNTNPSPSLKDLLGNNKLPPIKRRPRIPYIAKPKEKKEEKGSEGEIRAEKYFTENNIVFLREHTFPDCRNPLTGRLLYFDFWLPDFTMIIEVDGIQHYFKSEHFRDTDQSFADRQARDKIKDEYCILNNIKLVRILFSQLSVLERILKVNIV